MRQTMTTQTGMITKIRPRNTSDRAKTMEVETNVGRDMKRDMLLDTNKMVQE